MNIKAIDAHHLEVRFHLLKGKNYRKWQVKTMKGRKKINEYYFDPAEYQLEMKDCKLVNEVKKAEKVHAQQRKDVSGWVHCKEVLFQEPIPVDNLEKLFYNPIKDVYWRREGDAGEFVWDDSQYSTLITSGRQVYVLEENL
jgi:hypothetical protein